MHRSAPRPDAPKQHACVCAQRMRIRTGHHAPFNRSTPRSLVVRHPRQFRSKPSLRRIPVATFHGMFQPQTIRHVVLWDKSSRARRIHSLWGLHNLRITAFNTHLPSGDYPGFVGPSAAVVARPIGAPGAPTMLAMHRRAARLLYRGLAVLTSPSSLRLLDIAQLQGVQVPACLQN